MGRRVLIIGAGHAGGECALRLRRLGWREEIVLIGEEPHPPYQRPPLSKKYLCGEWDADRVLLRPREAYAGEGIELVTSTLVTRIDRDRLEVETLDGRAWRYDWLILATGSRARRPVMPGLWLSGVGVLRTIEDVNALKPRLKLGARLVIVGAGYVGLELAAVASALGLNVLVCESLSRPLSRTTSEIIAERLLSLHMQRGVNFRFGVKVAAVVGAHQAEGVCLEGGVQIAADLVVFGIGGIPETALASDCGLVVDDGVVTDENCRTSDRRIFAIGDCARRPIAPNAAPIRLESVHNAVEGAKLVAAQIADAGAEDREAPWFWSDQFDAKLQVAGLRAEDDSVIERREGEAFAVFYLRQGRVAAVECLNYPAAFFAGRALVRLGCVVDGAQLADASFTLKDIVAAATSLDQPAL